MNIKTGLQNRQCNSDRLLKKHISVYHNSPRLSTTSSYRDWVFSNIVPVNNFTDHHSLLSRVNVNTECRQNFKNYEYTISLTINHDLQHACVFLSCVLELPQLHRSEMPVGSFTAAHVGVRKSKRPRDFLQWCAVSGANMFPLGAAVWDCKDFIPFNIKSKFDKGNHKINYFRKQHH